MLFFMHVTTENQLGNVMCRLSYKIRCNATPFMKWKITSSLSAWNWSPEIPNACFQILLNLIQPWLSSCNICYLNWKNLNIDTLVLLQLKYVIIWLFFILILMSTYRVHVLYIVLFLLAFENFFLQKRSIWQQNWASNFKF